MGKLAPANGAIHDCLAFAAAAASCGATAALSARVPSGGARDVVDTAAVAGCCDNRQQDRSPNAGTASQRNLFSLILRTEFMYIFLLDDCGIPYLAHCTRTHTQVSFPAVACSALITVLGAHHMGPLHRLHV